MLKDIENIQVVSFGWFNTWLNLNPGKIELIHILRGNSFEQMENTISSLFKGVCLWQLGWNIILGLFGTAEWLWRKKSHLPVWTEKKIPTCVVLINIWPLKVMVLLYQEAKVLMGTLPGQGVRALHVSSPKGAHRKPSFDSEVLFQYENCVLLPCLRLLCCLLLGGLILEIDTRVWKQTMFSQIPRRGGQELHCSCCAMWVSGWCFICHLLRTGQGTGGVPQEWWKFPL